MSRANDRRRFEGGPHNGVNAYKFIEKLCNSRPDSMVLLDSYIHTKWAEMWKLNTGNVELITFKSKIQNLAGRMVHADAGYVTEAVCRNLRDWLTVLQSKNFFKVAKLKVKSIPQIWARDYSIKDKTERIWFSRPSAVNTKLVLRFVLNPSRTFETGKISFEGLCWGPPRPEPPPVEEAEDEGFAEMEEDSAYTVEGQDDGQDAANAPAVGGNGGDGGNANDAGN